MRLRGRGRLRFSPLFDLEDHKTLTPGLDGRFGSATSSIQMELAFGADVACEAESFVFCHLFVHGYHTCVRYNRSGPEVRSLARPLGGSKSVGSRDLSRTDRAFGFAARSAVSQAGVFCEYFSPEFAQDVKLYSVR